ncbi:gamma-glutamylcyclotransferase family protein [candidate division CSSED10-310 bacterium]|uniref:Gamma-glutamylcyclotransferase family protein n=1 Tax=candidate division CSSED10-310 bacterium TaxID=2855610 RepID=A0ABV6Z6Q8_UNCC1
MAIIVYFAYGSNLDQEQMQERCSDAVVKSRGYLADYALAFGGQSLSRGGGVGYHRVKTWCTSARSALHSIRA